MRPNISLLILGFCATKLFVAVSLLRLKQYRIRPMYVPPGIALIKSDVERQTPEVLELTHMDLDYWNQGEVPWDIPNNETFIKNKSTIPRD